MTVSTIACKENNSMKKMYNVDCRSNGALLVRTCDDFQKALLQHSAEN